MKDNLMYKLLPLLIRSNGKTDISVTGISMNPTLFEGDIITIQQYDNYEVGDILVFTYKTGELLVHRLLKKDNRYFCKGDNAFRLEDITYEQIIGKVTAVNGERIQTWDGWKIKLSYDVNRAFIKYRYDVQKTKQTEIYKLYNNIILRKEDGEMTYKKNEKMDYIKSDETSLAVFDPESGDTHFFDETGIDILEILSAERSLEVLLSELCKIYSVTAEEIKSDVEEFLASAVSKGIVKVV